jgi:hypothetical protein
MEKIDLMLKSRDEYLLDIKTKKQEMPKQLEFQIEKKIFFKTINNLMIKLAKFPFVKVYTNS